MTLQTGMLLRDNDPRKHKHGPYRIVRMSCYYVDVRSEMRDISEVSILRSRIYTDDKPRRTGWSVVP